MTRSLIPPPGNARVWIDFDGTITRQDVLDELITRYAIDDSWKRIEAQWQAGLIGSRECLSGQMATVRIGEAELEPFVASIQLDPGLTALIEVLQRHRVQAVVLSDGLDRFIGPLLDRAGIGDLQFRSNTFDRQDDRLVLRCPYANDRCESASAHCKCRSIVELSGGNKAAPLIGSDGFDHIYIGDGRSDLCPSRKVGCRFAKGVLAANLQREGIAFLPYDNLSEVAGILEMAWGAG